MRVRFNGKEYKKNARNGRALKNLCFDIFKEYLKFHQNLSYKNLQDKFNEWHCNNNFVVLSKNDWEQKTKDLRSRYFEPITYNSEQIYFTTQWGNNGGDCDNINNMISFAKEEGYDIDVIENSQSNKETSSIQIKNIILYGAPGVGKTHNYKNLISMIEEGKSQNEIFKTISQNLHVELENETFEKIKEEKRVEFVSFHQSYSYEDFIEGFRPNENGEIELDKKGGIFKRIADEARKNLDNSQKGISAIVEQKKFEEIFELFKDLIQDEIDRNKKFNINETVYISNIEEDAFRYTGDNWGNTQRMKFVDIELLYRLGTVERKEIKKLDNISGLAKQHATYFSYFMKKLINFKKSKNIEVNVESVKEKNFYIVIDEINRGNISKIFGELITLIEEDKRDEYEITLPYSKTKFKVPSNLYIIATMNSTDKSIATIDIALRRRFTFLKMQPNEDLVTNEQAKEFMHKANKYIKEKKGEDYMLGHSYFMKVTCKEDLDFVKEYKIKPLLEEYFYVEEKSADDILEEIEKVEMKENNE